MGLLDDSYAPRFGRQRMTPQQTEAAREHFEAQQGKPGLAGKALGLLLGGDR